MNLRTPLLLGLLLLLSLPGRAAGDALVTTRAMEASTILEVFIERDQVRVELEVSLSDVPAFLNAHLAQATDSPRPPRSVDKDTMETALAHGLTLRADAVSLVPEIVSVEAGRRLPRDEITGLPAPSMDTDGTKAERPVLFVKLRYPLAGTPAQLTLAPPTDPATGHTSVEIGFVLYHHGVAVNDFRYLGTEEAVDLDWSDPWFTRFQNRNLWRRFQAPLSVYLYVEPFEVRWEMILRPKDLQQWVDLGLEGADTIPVAGQAELKQRVVAFLEERTPMYVDGQVVKPKLDRIQFIRRSLRQTGIIDPPEDLPIAAAMLGVIFALPIEALPQTASLDWTLFSPKFPNVPSMATDEAGGLPGQLTAEDPTLTWQNFLKHPTIPALRSIRPPQPSTWPLPVLALLCFAAAVALLVLRRNTSVTQARKTRARRAALALVVLGAVAWPFLRVEVPQPFGGTRAPSQSEAEALMADLIANVYHAFDFHGEDRIYDTLARSTWGEVLSQVYLDTQRALAMQSQGGARVKIKSVAVEGVEVESQRKDGGFSCICRWMATGDVGHWGHIHQRANRYEAEFEVAPVDGAWKITALAVLDEERL